MRPSLTRGMIVTWAVCALLTMTACTKEEGASVSDQDGKVQDLMTDLRHLASGLPEAPRELQDDLTGLAAAPPAAEAMGTLTTTLATALSGKQLADADAEQLARLLSQAVNDRSAAADEVERHRAGVRELLTRIGADPAAVERVAEAQAALFSGNAD